MVEFTMKEAFVKVNLTEENYSTKEWQETCGANLFEVTKAIQRVKESLNEYLTSVIDQKKSLPTGDQIQFNDSDFEEESAPDSISGFIKGIGVVKKEKNESEKRRMPHGNKKKKIKK